MIVEYYGKAKNEFGEMNSSVVLVTHKQCIKTQSTYCKRLNQSLHFQTDHTVIKGIQMNKLL